MEAKIRAAFARNIADLRLKVPVAIGVTYTGKYSVCVTFGTNAVFRWDLDNDDLEKINLGIFDLWNNDKDIVLSCSDFRNILKQLC